MNNSIDFMMDKIHGENEKSKSGITTDDDEIKCIDSIHTEFISVAFHFYLNEVKTFINIVYPNTVSSILFADRN